MDSEASNSSKRISYTTSSNLPLTEVVPTTFMMQEAALMEDSQVHGIGAPNYKTSRSTVSSS